MASQIPLSLTLPGGATFENFVAGANREAFDYVVRVASGSSDRVTVLWGRSGTGKSHLLQAACHKTHSLGHLTAYLPLATNTDLTPQVLDGVESLALICLDDIEMVARALDWEQALFDLYNRSELTGARLLVSTKTRINALELVLPDLRSRLSSGVAFHLRDLADEQRHEVLRQRARERGFEMSPEVIEFLLRRFPRDMHALMGLLERLDWITLAEQRRVTIPFLKQVLANPTGW